MTQSFYILSSLDSEWIEIRAVPITGHLFLYGDLHVAWRHMLKFGRPNIKHESKVVGSGQVLLTRSAIRNERSFSCLRLSLSVSAFIRTQSQTRLVFHRHGRRRRPRSTGIFQRTHRRHTLSVSVSVSVSLMLVCVLMNWISLFIYCGSAEKAGGQRRWDKEARAAWQRSFPYHPRRREHHHG